MEIYSQGALYERCKPHARQILPESKQLRSVHDVNSRSIVSVKFGISSVKGDRCNICKNRKICKRYTTAVSARAVDGQRFAEGLLENEVEPGLILPHKSEV